jgi:hypothetical protein
MSKDSKAAAFSGNFRSELQIGKYTRWAADLDADTLQTLLWACGELGVRAASTLYRVEDETLHYSPHVLDPDPFINARLCTALRLIHAITSGQKLKLDDACTIIRKATADANQRSDCDPRLTAILKGCSVAHATKSRGLLQMFFSDGTTLTVKSVSEPLPKYPAGVVEDVCFEDGGLELNLSDGSSLWIATSEPGVSLVLGRRQGAAINNNEVAALFESSPPLSDIAASLTDASTS